MRERFTLDVPLIALFHEPTVQGLSRWLDAEAGRGATTQLAGGGVDQGPSWQGLVVTQNNSSRPPLFLLTGYMDADDTARILSNLIPHLGLDQPLCGLRPRWLDGQSSKYASVAEMTDDYVTQIRGFQPRGPYYLLGDCVGGVVMVEVAQKLVEQGDEVDLLMLLDTERPRHFSRMLDEVVRLLERGRHITGLLRQLLLPGERTRRQIISEVLQRKLRRAGLGSSAPTATDRTYQQRIAYRRLLKRHRLRRYHGRIELIVTDDVYRFVGLLGWNGFASGGLEVHRLAGDHETVRAQNAKDLGRRLRLSIDRALSQRKKWIANAVNGVDHECRRESA